MTTARGPIARMARAAAGRFACPDSWRASSSFSSSMSTRSSSFTSSGRLMSIQKFIVSQATNFGFFACSSTPSCSTGSMLARNTKSESRPAGGQLGLKSWKTFSWVSSVVRVEKSGA